MANCGSCCGRELELTTEELQMLGQLAQFSFLPVGKKINSENPIYLEENSNTVDQYGLIIALLEKKGLVSIDYEKPLKNADLSAYESCDQVGSMALTARGQQVLDILDLQGITE